MGECMRAMECADVGAVQFISGLLSTLCAAVGVEAASTGTAAVSAGTLSTAAGPAGAGGGSGVVAAVGWALLKATVLVAGPHDPSGVGYMVRAAVWALVAAAAALVGSRLDGLQRLFYEGVYPPPRNLKA
ncbi:hypothetical protein VaNZ11_007415 [Volvox africanus]|uniref:Uncharacterized protein n=1 Tax=Volvox africanus TaxID=51714 RepID=A0ABQ5S2V3_9CHLO|nr:hypothetical protein VaNZ11_007415 [Volvox africanus]